ncbi:MAG: CDP-alcohol phosphatidyltransferase family protein [Chlamydiae bacterium]|nr:CDP-alcohol phosphatidyltransferase family protein [Chlamydiota bacterium]
MFSLSNGLSILRAPLALLFLFDDILLRITAIILAMITDFIDGYLARRRRSTTQLGAILDPTMDKLFVFIAFTVLFFEHRLELWQILAMISRDFALCLFGLYLAMTGNWQAYRFKAIRWGKVTTALQFLVLICLTLHFSVPSFVYAIFILFGFLAFVELFQIKKQASIT